MKFSEVSSMALRNIIKVPDPLLYKKCRKIEKFDRNLSVLIDDMFETMKNAGGVGLAAPQVGLLKRIAVINVGDGNIELVNPEIIECSGEQREKEGCLSCPGKYGTTVRPKFVKVRAQDRKGEVMEYVGYSLKARAFCHEIDHLDGIIFTSRLA